MREEAAVYGVFQRKVYILPSTVYRALCTLYAVLCTLYNVLVDSKTQIHARASSGGKKLEVALFAAQDERENPSWRVFVHRYSLWGKRLWFCRSVSILFFLPCVSSFFFAFRDEGAINKLFPPPIFLSLILYTGIIIPYYYSELVVSFSIQK